ncbi:hypothetical protein BGZ65_008005, partial [Modicella reniformis]
MVFDSFNSSPRGSLSPKQALELANTYLENAKEATDQAISLVLCHDTELSLSQAIKGAGLPEDKALRDEVGTAYIQLGRVLEDRGYRFEARSNYNRGEKLGVKAQGQPAEYFDSNTTVHSTKRTAESQGSSLPPKQQKKDHDAEVISDHIFAENLSSPTTVPKLPAPDERLHDTPQLAFCLSLLKAAHSINNILEPDARTWKQTTEKDEDEQERLK